MATVKEIAEAYGFVKDLKLSDYILHSVDGNLGDETTYVLMMEWKKCGPLGDSHKSHELIGAINKMVYESKILQYKMPQSNDKRSYKITFGTTKLVTAIGVVTVTSSGVDVI